MVAVGVVDAADLHGRVATLDGHRLVGQEAHAAALDEARVRRLDERSLAVAVVVIAEHAEDAERRRQTQQLAPQLLKSGRAAGEVAGDDDEVRHGGQRQVDGLARGPQVEARHEPRVEVRELHDGEAVERRVDVRRRQAPVHAAHPLRLVQQIGETESGGVL